MNWFPEWQPGVADSPGEEQAPWPGEKEPALGEDGTWIAAGWDPSLSIPPLSTGSMVTPSSGGCKGGARSTWAVLPGLYCTQQPGTGEFSLLSCDSASGQLPACLSSLLSQETGNAKGKTVCRIADSAANGLYIPRHPGFLVPVGCPHAAHPASLFQSFLSTG